MKKDTIFKLFIFALISLGFVFVVIYYSNALPKSDYTRFEDWFSHTFNSKESSKEVIEKTFPVVPNGILYIESDGSDIEIETWDKNEVYVYIEKHGDKKRLDNYKVTFSATPQKVEIYGKNEQNFWNWGNFSVHFKIKVPKKFLPDISTSGGDIKIRDLEGDILCHTSGGNIKINRTIGQLKAKTSGGDIVLNELTGPIDINTSGGNLKLYYINGEINGETSGGNIELEMVGENKGVSLRTSGGNIHVFLPENTKAYLDCSTSGGGVNLNVPGGFSGNIEDEDIRGSLNGGGKEIRLRTSGGNIKISSKEKE
jgi:DUF4097 and DUF4098 domain-containing protein YvlB